MGDSGGRRLQWALRAASLAIIVFAVLQYTHRFSEQRLEIPVEPLAIDPQLARAPTVPLRPGDLAGRSLVLITLDTTRPDRLGLYGNESIATPNLDRLARGGVVFTGAHATASVTFPTHASILTGRYPHHHGARVNGRGHLGPDQATLAEILRAHGYETAAFVSSFVLDARFGLAQGFDVYDDETNRTGDITGYAERRAEDTTDAALAWLRNEHRGPFFLWVHYFDAHTSYEPPPEFAAASENPYDGELAYVDAQIGRLLAATGAALVAVTADHGESLGAQGEATHGLLVQEATIRVPLILGTNGGLPRPAGIDTLVSQVDLMPTLLSLLGIAAPEGIDGADLTRPVPAERPVLAEAHYGQAIYGWARLAAIYRGQLKYVDGPVPELYDLAADPREQRNLAAARPGEAAALRRELLALRGPEADTLPVAPEWSDLEVIARLEALGYVVGGATQANDGRNGPNPRDQLADLARVRSLVIAPEKARRRNLPAWQMLLGWKLFGVPRNPAETIAALESFATERPDFAPIYSALALLYDDAGDSEAAEKAREKFGELISDR